MTPAEARSLKVGDRVAWRAHGCQVGKVIVVDEHGVTISFSYRSLLLAPFDSEEWLGMDREKTSCE